MEVESTQGCLPSCEGSGGEVKGKCLGGEQKMAVEERQACKAKRLMCPWGWSKVGKSEQGDVGRRR